MGESPQEPRLAQAVELFNAREFFDCHDVLEEIWSETLADDRTFYQGLIHAAVALYHFSEGNLGGARKMSFSAVRYLAAFGPTHAGLAVELFRRDFLSCCAELQSATETTIANVQLNGDRVPMLHWADFTEC